MEQTTWVDTGVDGRIISKRISKKHCENVDWIHLVQSRDQWRALVNTVIKLQSLLTDEEPSNYQLLKKDSAS
jgi:hypothetical protein